MASARTVLVRNIGLLATPEGGAPLRGAAQGAVRRRRDASVLLVGGVVAGVAEGGEIPRHPPDVAASGVEEIDAGGRLATPGLVDAHTHLVFAGFRQHEVPLRLRGASYGEILAAGGGILSTVAATRAASEDALFERAVGFVREMAGHGVVLVEAKSGYGLDAATEEKQLRVVRRLASEPGLGVGLVPTFLGAHAVPPEYAGRADAYVDLVCREMLPRIAAAGLAEACDVFCERGAFTPAQSRRVLAAAAALGLRTKVHADELEESGGSALAAEIGAASAEHLVATGDAALDGMARAGTVAVLLPGTSLYLDRPFARAREMVARGVPVAIATDFNPGSCPSPDLELCMTLGYVKYRLSPEEILVAVTLNAACALGRGATHGSVEPGKSGGVVLWDAEDLETLAYRMGSRLALRTIR